MADLGEDFDFNDAPEAGGYTERKLLAEGDYLLRVSESEFTRNKADTGSNIFLTFEVLDGPDSGVTFRQCYCYEHPKTETVQKWAREALQRLRNALGLTSFRRTEQLHDIPFIGTVKQSPSTDPKYGPSNEVRRYTPRSSAAKAAAPATPVNTTRATPPAKPGSNAPWLRTAS